MFFVLSKTLGILLLPTNFLIGIGLLGAILLATRWALFGRKLLTASIVMLAICGFSPLGNWLLYPLESRFPAWDATRGAPDGIVILGGSKVSDKIGVIKALMEKADTILICGAMANTFLEAQGVHMGSSRVERDKLDLARELLDWTDTERSCQEGADIVRLLGRPRKLPTSYEVEPA